MDVLDRLTADAPNLTPSMVIMVFPTPLSPSGILTEDEIIELNATMAAYGEKFIALLLYQNHPRNPKVGYFDQEVKELCPVAIDNIKRYDRILAYQLEKNNEMDDYRREHSKKVRIQNVKFITAVRSILEKASTSQEDNDNSVTPEASDEENKDEKEEMGRERLLAMIRLFC